jgi:hypothetical protein
MFLRTKEFFIQKQHITHICMGQTWHSLNHIMKPINFFLLCWFQSTLIVICKEFNSASSHKKVSFVCYSSDQMFSKEKMSQNFCPTRYMYFSHVVVDLSSPVQFLVHPYTSSSSVHLFLSSLTLAFFHLSVSLSLSCIFHFPCLFIYINKLFFS